jgi:endo-1,4-beta-xylanase
VFGLGGKRQAAVTNVFVGVSSVSALLVSLTLVPAAVGAKAAPSVSSLGALLVHRAQVGPHHPEPIPSRTKVPLGAAFWYACADPAYGGPAPLACQVPPSPPQTAAGLAASYSSTFNRYFDQLTPENEFKMLWTEPNPWQFDFSLVDKVVAYAQANNMHVHGSALIYAAANPSWVNSPLLPWLRPTLLAAMRNHITTEITHFQSAYPGVVDAWDVVNEPFLDSGARDPNVYQQVIGDDWIAQAFRAANVADPGALLFLNEFNADTPNPRQQAVLALVKHFVAAGVPIDGVGLEMHVGAGGTYPTLAQLEQVMGEYGALGLRVDVTELDALRPVPDDRGDTQRAADDTVAEACREMTNCTSLTVWGVADQYSWRGVEQHADLFNRDFIPKPAYADVRCRLDDPRPASGSWTPKPCPSGSASLLPTAVTEPTGPTNGSSVASNVPTDQPAH